MKETAIQFASARKQKDGYLTITVDGTTVGLHRVVWELHNGPLPGGHIIHHVDGDPSNNDPGNLVAVTHSEHHRIHHGWVVDATGAWLKPCGGCGEMKDALRDFSPIRTPGGGTRPRSLCRQCESDANRERYQRQIVANREAARIRAQARRDDPEMREAINASRRDKLATDPQYREAVNASRRSNDSAKDKVKQRYRSDAEYRTARNESNRRWREANRDKVIADAKARYYANHDENKQKARERSRRRYMEAQQNGLVNNT